LSKKTLQKEATGSNDVETFDVETFVA